MSVWSVLGTLAAGQALAESRMRDTCTVTVPSTTQGTIDPNTGLETDAAPTTLYTGKCRLRMSGTVSGSTARDVAGDRVSTSAPTLSVPISAPRLPLGAIVTVTNVPADDPAGHLRLGVRARVSGLLIGTDMTAQRVQIEAVTG